MVTETSIYRILTEAGGYIAPKVNKELPTDCGECPFKMLFSDELSKMIAGEEFFSEGTEKEDDDKAVWDQVASICIGPPTNLNTVFSEEGGGLNRADIEGVISAGRTCNGDADSMQEEDGVFARDKVEKKVMPFETAETLSALETAENVKDAQSVEDLSRWSDRIDGRIANGEKNAIAAEKDMNSDKQGIQIEPDAVPPDTLQGQPSTMNIADLGEITYETAERVEPYSQIGREIQFRLDKKGPMEFTMQLEPKNLGEIDIKLKIKDGKLMIDIMAARAKTQTLLSGQVDKLIMSLGLRNVLVERVQIDKPADFRHKESQGQGFIMNGETDLSHGKQQDRLSRQWSRQNSSGARNWEYGIDASFSAGAVYGAADKTGFVKMDYII